MSKSLLQSSIWANFKSQSGWINENIEDTSVLIRPLIFNYKIAYVPEVSDKDYQKWLPIFNKHIKQIAQKHNIIFTRLELLESAKNEPLKQLLKENKYIKSFEFIQPEHRRIIDISQSEEDILTQMKQKGRYNLKIARRHQVTVKIFTDPKKAATQMDVAYELFSVTGNRKNFSVRSKQYFSSILDLLLKNDAGALFIAYYQNEPIATLIISFYDGVASYLYGGSSTKHKEVMAPYLAHWAVIEEAKRRHCRTYDMLGAAPPDQSNHPYAGFTRFKEQFGGQYIHLLGSHDLIFKPFWYTIFCLAEKYRRRKVIG